jgi:hypothetical protein
MAFMRRAVAEDKNLQIVTCSGSPRISSAVSAWTTASTS